ncbi:MAG: sigma-70 family RNA polymerase sigma factor [Planctomycetes bacterium]|nr:sigma-70 family RNA polymerase sigma factor [Planctomycetota bacterium]
MRQGLTKLLHRVADGDTVAYNEFYESARPLIQAVLHRTLYKEDFDAAEQEIAVAVWQEARKFDRSRASAETWVAMITRSRALDFARASASRRRTEKVFTEGASNLDEETPSANIAKDELREMMRKHVDTLPEAQRTLVELSFFVGLSQREIAKALDMPLGTVKTRIRTAFQTLAELLPPPV